MIPAIPLVTETVRPLNARLFELCGKEAGGKLTQAEKHELDCLCEFLEEESGQTNAKWESALAPIEARRVETPKDGSMRSTKAGNSSRTDSGSSVTVRGE